MKLKIAVWLTLYASTIVAASGAIWFAGNLNANNWIAPDIAPPAWLFGPVWTVLYLFIATSAYRVIYAASHRLKGFALAFWGLQMCLNTLWTPVFFGAFDLPGALVLIAVLWVVIGAYSFVSFSIDRKAGYLFLPYWAWVSFATILNYKYMILNPN